METMSTGTIDLDTKRYGRLLAKALPTVIKSEDENNRMLAIIEGLMAKGEKNLTAEEDALLELLVDLVHDFEEKHYPLSSSPPHQMVAFLLEQRRLKPSALRCPAGRRPRRRWSCVVPAQGEPKGLVPRIESGMLDALPGTKLIYAGWDSQTARLKELLQGCHKIAMQYSPQCAVPYVAMVDGGTLELVRQSGVEVVTSANLIQLFEARWSDEQLEMHLEAGRRVDRIRAAAFDKIGASLRTEEPITEWTINRFIRVEFAKAGMVTDHGPIVAVNVNMSNPHYEPTEEKNQPIHKGDAVLIDMWAKLEKPDAVYYDITWTGFC